MGTYEDVAEKYNVTPDQVKQLKNAMCATWGCIAGDWYNCFGGESEAYDAYDSEAEMIAEATIDADRIRDYSQDDMDWVYKNEAGQYRPDVMQLAQDTWECRW